jgi:hypothetical protein
MKNKIIKQMFKQMPKEDFDKPSPTIINLAEDLLEKGDLFKERNIGKNKYPKEHLRAIARL